MNPLRPILRVAGRTALVAAAVAALTGCVVVPRTVTGYDARCQTVSRHVVLEAAQLAFIGSCRAGAECQALLATAGVLTAATAVISGSIALVGNAVYWLERQGPCPTPPATAPTP